jgi:hypothetical protein
MMSLLGSNLPLLAGIAEEIQCNASERNLNEKARLLQSTLADLSKQAGSCHDKTSKDLREMEIYIRKRLMEIHRSIRLWLLTGFLSLAILLGSLVILVR